MKVVSNKLLLSCFNFALIFEICREGIEDEIVAMSQELIRDNRVRKANGILVRHNSAQN